MRLVRDEVIWLHGAYEFADLELMHHAMVAAQQLIERRAAKLLTLSCSIVDFNELAVIVRIPMFEERDVAASLFGMLARFSSQRMLEARVDVL